MRGLLFLSALLGRGAPKPFVSEEGSFAVSFPRAPIYATLPVPTPEGPQLRHVFRYSDHELRYFITHTCIPPPTLPAGPGPALDLRRDAGLQMPVVTLVPERRVS